MLTRAPNVDESAAENSPQQCHCSLLHSDQLFAFLCLIKSIYLLVVLKSFSESRWANDAMDCSGNVQIAGFAFFLTGFVVKKKTMEQHESDPLRSEVSGELILFFCASSSL